MVGLDKSEAGRWVPCPASPTLQVELPEHEPSEDEKEGTAAHWLAAQVLGRHHGFEELTDRAAPNGVIMTGKMVDYVGVYLDTVGSTPVVVERVLESSIPGVNDGFPDALRIDETGAGHIYEFKYGWRPVDAVNNWQGANYIVDLFAKHSWNLPAVTFYIVQPRPYHPDGRVRSWTVDRAYGQQLAQFLTERATATRDPAALAVTGPHCRYCKALTKCKAARIASLNAVDVSTQGLLEELPPDEIANEISTLRRAAEALKLRLDARESEAVSFINNGGIVPGFDTKRSYGNERWKNDDISALEMLSGKVLTEKKNVTPGQAKKITGMPELVRTFTTTPQTGVKLVERDSSLAAKEAFK